MDQDSTLLGNLFSPEVWTLVLEKFAKRNAFNDIENSINASLYFRKLLKGKITTLLFPKVFEKLAPKYENGDDDAYDEDALESTEDKLNENPDRSSSESDDDNEDLDILQNPGPRKKKRRVYDGEEFPAENTSVLKCRLVCRTWRAGVDQFYQNLSYHYKMNHDHDDSLDDTERFKEVGNWTIYLLDDTKFTGTGNEWSLEKFNSLKCKNTIRFLHHFNETHSSVENSKNPFLGRALKIKDAPTERNQIFLKAITKILEMYGQHVWFCVISIGNSFPNITEYYIQIRNWLKLMPNLKVVQIKHPLSATGTNSLSDRESRQLRKEIRSNPLPEMASLTCLKTSRIPAPIFNELLNKHIANITMLEVETHQSNNGYDVFNPILPKLKHISLTFHSEMEFKNFVASSISWNLETLYLDYDYDADFIEWSEVFKAINNKCTDTVKSLMISLPKAKTINESERLLKDCALGYKLQMTQVKRFKLYINDQAPIDFILPMQKSLEVLEVYFGYDSFCYPRQKEAHVPSCNQLIQFAGFETELYNSNIWDLFPKLKKIYVDRNEKSNSNYLIYKIHTREEWLKIG